MTLLHRYSANLRFAAYKRIPALLLAVTLALALGLVPAPTLLLAAPVAQEDEPAVMGYYESEVIPGDGDTPDLVVGLILYEDGTAEVISEYQNDQDVIVEVGTWVDNGDGTMTLTVTGTSEEPYAAPIDLDFEVGEDGSLVVPGSVTGAFGEAGLILLPTALGNSDAILADISANALVFQSDVMESASSPGLQLTLALFEDGSLQLVSDYMNADEIVVEVGTWVENEDGSLAITLTGQVEGDDDAVTEYPEPLEFVFTTNDDGSLALVDEGGALFGEAGLTLVPTVATGEVSEETTGEEATEEEPAEEGAEATPEVSESEVVTETEEATEESTPEAEATEEVTEEATPEPEATEEVSEEAGEEATEEPIGEVTTGTLPSGVYISDLLPSDDGTNTFLVTIFYDDGSILFSTYPLNGDDPITEKGIWADNGDGTYIITATGTLDEEYDEPFEVAFTMDEDGIVTITDVPLYPLEDINLAAAPSLVFEFQSDLITDTIDIAHTLTLAVYDDLSAELVTTYLEEGEGYTEYGEWNLDEATDQLLVTLTSDDEGDYDEPVEWLFDVTTEENLVLANDDEGYYGEDGLTLFPVVEEEPLIEEGASEGEETGETPEEGTEEATEGEEAVDEGEADLPESGQIFQSEVLPAASSPGLQLTLGLSDDGRAALDYDYLNGEEVVTNLGVWIDNLDGTITLTFTEGPQGPLDLPIELTVQLDDAGNLIITDASEESSGLIDVVLAPIVLE